MSLAVNHNILTIGGADVDKYSNGAIIWVEQADEWYVNIQEVSVDSLSINNRVALVDSGSSYIMVPRDDFNQLLTAFPQCIETEKQLL